MTEHEGITVHEVTVGLCKEADEALTSAAELTGRNHTDTINAALVVYNDLWKEQKAGKKILITEPKRLVDVLFFSVNSVKAALFKLI